MKIKFKRWLADVFCMHYSRVYREHMMQLDNAHYNCDCDTCYYHEKWAKMNFIQKQMGIWGDSVYNSMNTLG